MNITPFSAQKSTEAVQQIFEQIERADAGEFIVGDSLSLTDIAFASLAAPLILPPEYGSSLPSFGALSTSTQQMIQRFRSLEAGKCVLRLSKVYRNAV